MNLPWEFKRSGNCGEIFNSAGTSICSDTEFYPWAPSWEEMEFIVRAVNAHGTLVAIVRRAAEKAYNSFEPENQSAHYSNLKAALALADEKL
jgi:hypothetical protein